MIQPTTDKLTTKEVYDHLIESLVDGQPFCCYICIDDRDRMRCVRRFEERRLASPLAKMPFRKPASNAYIIDECSLLFLTISEFANYAISHQKHPFAEFWDPRAYDEAERRIEAHLRSEGELA